MDYEKEKIDIATWKRKLSYDRYAPLPDSTISIAVDMDVTTLVKELKKNKRPFYCTMTYCALKALNPIDNFHYRIENGQLVRFKEVPASVVFSTKTNYITLAQLGYAHGYKEFEEHYEKAKKYCYETGEMYGDCETQANLWITSLPWVSIKAITSPTVPGCTNPEVVWDKFVKKGFKYFCTVNIKSSHVFTDGSHLCQLANAFQKEINNFNSYIK